MSAIAWLEQRSNTNDFGAIRVQSEVKTELSLKSKSDQEKEIGKLYVMARVMQPVGYDFSTGEGADSRRQTFRR